MDQMLLQFLNTLSPFENLSNIPVDTLRSRLVTYTICHVAVIQLHGGLNNSTSNQRCLQAAQAVLLAIDRIGDITEWKFIHPIMGVRTFMLCHSHLILRS